MVTLEVVARAKASAATRTVGRYIPTTIVALIHVSCLNIYIEIPEIDAGPRKPTEKLGSSPNIYSEFKAPHCSRDQGLDAEIIVIGLAMKREILRLEPIRYENPLSFWSYRYRAASPHNNLSRKAWTQTLKLGLLFESPLQLLCLLVENCILVFKIFGCVRRTSGFILYRHQW